MNSYTEFGWNPQGLCLIVIDMKLDWPNKCLRCSGGGQPSSIYPGGHVILRSSQEWARSPLRNYSHTPSHPRFCDRWKLPDWFKREEISTSVHYDGCQRHLYQAEELQPTVVTGMYDCDCHCNKLGFSFQFICRSIVITSFRSEPYSEIYRKSTSFSRFIFISGAAFYDKIWLSFTFLT